MTVNNYTDDDEEQIKSFCIEENVKYAIFGKEIGENGTRHLQGFVHLHRKVRLNTIKKNISKTGHFEIARGTDDENQEYCKKDGDLLLEVGFPGAKPGTNKSFVNAMEMVDQMIDGASAYDLIEGDPKYAAAYMRHSRCIEDLVSERKKQIAKDRFDTKFLTMDIKLYDWQKDLYHMLTTEEPHDRFIYWYVDYVGGAGKSTFVNYFLSRHINSVCFFGGKINDLSYAYDYQKVVFFDLARSGASDYLFGFIEQMKNGRIFSSKYKSFIKYFPSPHVVVFSNKLPDDGVFSADRVIVTNVTGLKE